MRRVGQVRKRDANEAEIVKALRQLGVVVLLVSGEGCPDLLCYHQRAGWVPIEVKRPRGKLTSAQKDTRAVAPFVVVESIDQALALFGGIR